MPLDTNFNVSPYFDDFDEQRNFHRVLFKPGVSVQARELTQLQTILQNQVERFGENIFKTGTIISGCSISTDGSLDYVKIRDSQVDGQPAALSLYNNSRLINETSNLEAVVVNYSTGFESTSPDLNTLYVRYLNTGTSGEKLFTTGSVLKSYNPLRTVEKVNIVDGGEGYSNSDVVVFSGTGTGATAIITTDTDGVIVDVSMVSKGTGYTSAPSVSVTSATSTSTASLTSQIYIAELTVATVAQSGASAPTGRGYSIKVSEGIVYQKGNFIRVDSQEKIVSKYTRVPNDVVVGFYTDETIINSNIDNSLLDNATGTFNYAAPGADRLKLTPSLTVLTSDEAATNNEFLALLEFQDGLIVRDRTSTQFNSVNRELKKRTFEESGNYVLETIGLGTSDIPNSDTHLNVTINPGIAYVQGERVEILNKTFRPTRKATDTDTFINQSIGVQYGNYVEVDELLGVLDTSTVNFTVALRNTAGNAVTGGTGSPTTPGSTIGTARVRALEYKSGVPGTPTGTYRLYIFDIKMSRGYRFAQVRSISYTNFIADIVLTNGNAVIHDVILDTLLFPAGNAIKGLTDNIFTYRTRTSGYQLDSTGTEVVEVTEVNGSFPYAVSSLTDTVKQGIIVIPHQSFRHQANNTGTLSTTTSSAVVTGVGTSFLTEYEVGDYIAIANTSNIFNTPKRIANISNNTSLSLSANFVENITGGNHTTGYLAYTPIDFTKNNKDIELTDSTHMQLSVGNTINLSTVDISVYHDVRLNPPTVRQKLKQNEIYVKLSTDSFSTVDRRRGPWCLGIPDAYTIDAVYVSSSNSYSTAVNKTNYFELDNGQRDSYYGLSYLKLKNPRVGLNASSSILVKLKAFRWLGSGSFFSANSYQVTSSIANSTHVAVSDIPVFISPVSGSAISLRDALDFRPQVQNTAVYATSAGTASIDPAANTATTYDSNQKYFPSTTAPFIGNIEAYLGRIDRVVIDSTGTIRIIEGDPSTKPVAPLLERNVMELGQVHLAPFPSLSAKGASNASRPDLKNNVVINQTPRYTMRDIATIEARISRLEYYTLLNSIEQDTKNLTIPSEANTSLERFKNGFFVDPFNNYDISNINDAEYSSLIDTDRSILSPQKEHVLSDLKINSGGSSNVTFKGDLALLQYTSVPFVYQDVANKERTLVEELWRYNGNMAISPNFDNYFDNTVKGTSDVYIDNYGAVKGLVDAINSVPAVKNQTTSSIKVDSPVKTLSSTSSTSGWVTTTVSSLEQTTTTTNKTSFQAISLPDSIKTTQTLGTFLTDVAVNQYIRPQKIGLVANGLRPSAKHYVFFDNQNITSFCEIGTVDEDDLNEFNLDKIKLVESKGTAVSYLTANSSGMISCVVNLPGDTFTTGERQFLLMDIDNTISESSATSKASTKFTSFGMTGASTTASVSTKSVDFAQNFGLQTFTDTQVSSSTRNWNTVSIVDNTPSSDGGGFDGGGFDPLAQTFYVEKLISDNYILTEVDIFFKQKHPTLGVTLQIRETDENGYPTKVILPFGQKRLTSNQVNVSSTAATATKFTFNTPVSLTAGKDYAIVLLPDANNPDYRVWTAVAGVPDVSNPNRINNSNFTNGTLFYSTSGRSFTAVQGEDLKFKAYRAKFNKSAGKVRFNNGDNEYLLLDDNTTNAFRGGELVSQISNTYVNATITGNTTSRVINTSTSLTGTFATNDYMLVTWAANTSGGNTLSTATGNAAISLGATTLSNTGISQATAFTSDYANGAFILLANSTAKHIRQIVSITDDSTMTLNAPLPSGASPLLHYNVTPKFDICKVVSANTTAVVSDRPLQYSTTNYNSSIQKVVTGTVYYYNGDDNKLRLSKSNASGADRFYKANSTFLGTVVGEDTDSVGYVANVENVTFTNIIPLTSVVKFSYTTANLVFTLTKSGGGTVTKQYAFDDKSYIDINDTVVVKSLSNEISSGSGKSMIMDVNITTSANDTSVIVDYSPASIISEIYEINNDDSNENTRSGNATCKYISKKIELADGLDAEDIKVVLTAYKPSGTDIKVYAKVLASSDYEIFDDKEWSELDQQTASGVYSSTKNIEDFREFEFTFKQSPQSTKLPGRVTTYGNTIVDGSGIDFTSYLTSNSIVKVVYGDSDYAYEIVPVESVISSTKINLAFNTIDDAAYKSDDFTIELVDKPLTAFKYNFNPSGNNIVRYYDSEQAAHDNYKYLALKIVLLSNTNYTVPFVRDYRAVAVSI